MRIVSAVLLIASIAPAAISQPLRASLVTSVTPEDGGPERMNGPLAVGSTGVMAFTFGYDNRDRHVTVMDASGRTVSRLAGQGAGPGEFASVLALFIVDSTLIVGGAGQVSAFSLAGRHLWSRAVPPLQLLVGANRDSLDLLDATHFADGRGVGSVHRRSTARGGGDRLLFDGQSGLARTLARGADDSTRFPRLGFASSATAFVIANAQRAEVLRSSADGTRRELVGPPQPVRRRTSQELNTELAARERSAARPFRLPDGRRVTLPFNREAERQRLRSPVPYFNARFGGLQFDGTSAYLIESRADSTLVTRVGPRAGERASVAIACDSRESAASLAMPFFLVVCSVETEGERVPVLRLYRLQ